MAKILPFPIWEFDPAIAVKEQTPKPADVVVCTDVLEHVEPDYLDAVLVDLRRVTKVCLFVAISTKPANKNLSDGRNAHLIVESADWWVARLSKLFVVTQRVDSPTEVQLLLKRK